LKTAGVISDEKRGLQVFYRLDLPCVAHFIACLDHPERHPELMREPVSAVDFFGSAEF